MKTELNYEKMEMAYNEVMNRSKANGIYIPNDYPKHIDTNCNTKGRPVNFNGVPFDDNADIVEYSYDEIAFMLANQTLRLLNEFKGA